MGIRPLLVNAAELQRRPGTDKTISVATTVGELGITDERFEPADGVQIELRLESVLGGIVVAGTIAGTWHGSCRRCAIEIAGPLHSEVHELYQQVVVDPDAFELTGDQLDLTPMVREVMVLDAPVAPLCRPDCAGLCPVCGTDRNVAPCDCDVTVEDPRWAGLAGLRLDPPADA